MNDVRTEREGSLNWHDVPNSLIGDWVKVFEASREGTDLSTPCPVCGAHELHRWYYRGRPVDEVINGRHYVARGGEWEWCSNCRSYVHYSAFVPEWWSSDIDLPLSVLKHNPEPIEQEIRRRRREQ